MTPDASPPLAPLTLSVRQRDLIVDLSLAPPETLAKIRFAVPLGESVVLNLSIDALNTLGAAVLEVLRQAESTSLKEELSDICRDIAVAVGPHLGPEHDALMATLDALPPPLRGDVVALLAEGEFESPAELLSEIERLTLDFASEALVLPDTLSVPEFNTLVSCDWDEHSPGLCLNTALPLDRLRDATLLSNARIFLQTVADAGPGGVRATAAGNLNRKFVATMLDTLHWPPGYADRMRLICKVINEDDLRGLGLIRFLAKLAGLIRRTKGSFHVTKKGKAMLREEKSGALYARLFRAFFQEYCLSGEDVGAECPLLQDTIACSLLMLSRHAAEWQPQQEMIETVLPGGVAKDYLLHGGFPEFEWFCEVVQARLFRPLAAFGLLEFDLEPEAFFCPPLSAKLRKTPLFDAFLTFDLPETDS
jgi:hypothetical protein